MSACCSTYGNVAGAHFDEKIAKRDLESYRKKGPGTTARLLRDLLVGNGAVRGVLLDVGSGVGGLSFELLDRGAERVIAVDASPAYLAAAAQGATRRDRLGVVEFIHGDFVDVGPQIPSATIVTLDRVICCYRHPRLQQFSRPRFDPRGRAVAVHGTSGDGTQGIFRVDMTTGEVTLLASNPPAVLANPAWSRDGRTLFFERDDRAVWMLHRENNQTTQVFAFSASAPNFTSTPSPDGRQLASVHGASLYLIDVGNREAKEILRVDKPERLHDFPGSLAWMPDGRTIIFGKALGDKRELWRISKDGTGLQPAGLEVERRNLYFLRVSQDGTRMAFVMGDYDIRPLEVWVMENFLR